MDEIVDGVVRAATLQPFVNWEVPTPDEIKNVVARLGLIRGARMTGADVAQIVGFSGSAGVGRGSRTYRRWVAGESNIPYSAWCVLCYEAGFGVIWDTKILNGGSDA